MINSPITYSPQDVADSMRRAGFGETAIPTGIAVSTAESGRRTVKSAVDPNSWGPWQLNLDAHPYVSVGCALNLDCSTQAAYKISKGGSDWGPWSVYTSGAYLNFLNIYQPTSVAAAPIRDVAPVSLPTSAIPSVGTRVAGVFPTVPLLGFSTLGIGKALLTIGIVIMLFFAVVKMVGAEPVQVAQKMKGAGR